DPSDLHPFALKPLPAGADQLEAPTLRMKPLYLVTCYLQTSGGALVAYSRCPADTSLVSICGLLLY
ncbi:MAG TPA: hypothetical protein VF434_10215, partial [Promineifilum sp.]